MRLSRRTFLIFLLLLLSENRANNDEQIKEEEEQEQRSSYAEPKSRTIRALAALADDFIGEALESALKGDFSMRNLFEGATTSEDEDPMIKESTKTNMNGNKRSKRQAAQARTFAIDPDLVYEVCTNDEYVV